MRVAVYARYSSDLQDARSISDQISLLREHATRQGWQMVGEFTDAAISGASLHNRPGLLALIEAAEAGRCDAILAESLDRLSRDLGDIASLHKRLAYRGVKLHTLADGGEVPRLMVGIKGAISEFYLADLAAKTKRGQIGRVKAGRIPGGRCYGYDVVRDDQDRGRRAINEAEATIVRRVFAEYLDGRSPLKIVQTLNVERIPGPRGGQWNASALLGSAKRRNGLLNNSLYRGRITYNRQRFVKDPATGRRQARANPQEQWLTQDVPELAIVSPEVFEGAQARRDAFGRVNPLHHRRPKHLLSGMLVCGSCGTNMIVRNVRGTITNFGCSARINRGGCSNARSIGSAEIEGRVLAALRKHLLAPDVIAAAIDAYRAERQRLSREAAKAMGSMDRELADTKRQIAQVIRLAEDGGDTKMLAPRLNDLGARQRELEARLAVARAPDVVELHPQAADRYAAKVADIQAALATGDAAGLEALALTRDLIRRVRVMPTPRGEPVGLEIAGDLAALLTMNESGTAGMVSMVAGVGFEPTSFRV